MHTKINSVIYSVTIDCAKSEYKSSCGLISIVAFIKEMKKLSICYMYFFFKKINSYVPEFEIKVKIQKQTNK